MLQLEMIVMPTPAPQAELQVLYPKLTAMTAITPLATPPPPPLLSGMTIAKVSLDSCPVITALITVPTTVVTTAKTSVLKSIEDILEASNQHSS